MESFLSLVATEGWIPFNVVWRMKAITDIISDDRIKTKKSNFLKDVQDRAIHAPHQPENEILNILLLSLIHAANYRYYKKQLKKNQECEQFLSQEKRKE